MDERRRSAALVAWFAVATATILAPMALTAGRRRGRRSGILDHPHRPVLHPETDQDRRKPRCDHHVGHRSVWRAGRHRPNQIPSPLVSQGLRTVDGSCNNLVAGKEKIGAADQLFPRLTSPFAPPRQSTRLRSARAVVLRADAGNVFDTEPRTVSNLIVDQTSTNPAAIAAAGFPVRTQGNPGVVPCTTEPTNGQPAGRGSSHGLHAEIPDAVHSQRDNRRRPLAAVQLAVHAVRPVLRPRHGPDRQGRRHGLRSAEGR